VAILKKKVPDAATIKRARKRDLPRVGCAVPISLWMVQKCRLFRPGQGPPQIA
jgi:hypothetical protein